MKPAISLLALIFTVTVYAQNAKEPVKVTDMLKIKAINSVALTRDGSRVAFSVTNIEPEETKWEYKYVAQIWTASTDGTSPPRQLTFTLPGAAQPAWSPDGTRLAFVRTVDGKPQLFLLSMQGGEPVQLTRYKYGASSPRWSDDGKQLLFTTSVGLQDLLKDSSLNSRHELPKWNFEKPGFSNNSNLKRDSAKADPDGNLQEVRAYLDNNAKDGKAKVIDKLQFQEESTTSAEMNFSHILLMDASPNGVPHPLTSGFYSFTNPQFVHGTNQVIFEGDDNDSTHPDRTQENEIFIANKDGSGLKKLLGRKNFVYSAVAVSPSGKWIAFLYGKTGFLTMADLGVMPVDGSEKDIVELPLDRSKGNLRWSGDEQYVYFTAAANGGFTLNRADVKTRKVEQLTGNDTGVSNYDIAANNLVYVKTEVANPFELYHADADAKNAQRISSFNYDWLKNKTITQPGKHTFVNDKGMTIEYWAMKPSNYAPGKKYPVVLAIHGGPAAMWGPGESTMWHEFQFWCGKGYGVVYSNPRGSGGYDLPFMRSIINDWSKGPASDVLTALDKATSEGWIDTSKLFVTGGSYAGYLVAYIISKDHRFKAACSQRGVYDFRTFFGEGNAWRLVPEYFGGYPWEQPTATILDRESPISYVKDITTPYIIFHGENDLRTGVVQSEELFKSLKVLERPVEYVRHPGATHEITRSGNNRQRIDQMLRAWEFFERFVH